MPVFSLLFSTALERLPHHLDQSSRMALSGARAACLMWPCAARGCSTSIFYTADMNDNPKSVWNAHRLDVRAFAQAGATLQAETPLSSLERLQAESFTLKDSSARLVAWRADGELRPGSGGQPTVWLHLTAQARLPLGCQRCLGPVDTALDVDRWFRFVADEATAEAEDEDAEEDVLALEPRPDLLLLLEDELLMGLPLVPMHDTCPEAVRMQVGDPAAIGADVEPRKHPFAGLAKLKK
jgi:uncharacterized protein